MRTTFFKAVPAITLRLKQSSPLNHSSSPLLLKPISASLRLCGLHFRWGFAALLILFAAQPARLPAQNIPPMIGDHVGKPKLRIPNPLESAQKGGSQTSQSSQSGQSVASAAGEREIHGFLENWRSSLSKKDVEALSYCYLQTEALRVYWESQEFSGWEPFKAEMQRRFASPEGVHLELKEPQTSVFGRFAWVTARYLRQTWTEATPKSQEGLITLVLEKRRSAWVILHQHASIASAASPMNLSTK
ncbi:MAG: nuclear transport factor 2 family protein [Terriglobia bacterium]